MNRWFLLFFLFTEVLYSDVLLNTGDIVSLTVLGEKELSGEYIIDEKGCINLMIIGCINLKGMNLADAENKIRDIMGRDLLKEPVVKLELKQSRTNQVFVLGEVRSPGGFAINSDNILDFILLAGGPTQSAADVVIILKRDKDGAIKERIEKKLSEIISNTGIFKVEGGDVIYIARREGRDILGEFTNVRSNAVYVLGEVKSPGAYEYKDGYTLLDVIVNAGGPTEFAAKGRVKIYRVVGGKREEVNIDLDDIIKKKTNPQVSPGDIIYVPERFF